MAQDDVHELDGGLVVDCQSNLLGRLSTRVIVPLIRREQAPKPASRFNPIFTIDGVDYVLDTQFVGVVERGSLGPSVTSLEDHSYEVTDAFDVLISGV